MTNREAVESIRALGFYAKANDDGGFRGGTARHQEGSIGLVDNGFVVMAEKGRWIVRTPGLGQQIDDREVETLDEAFTLAVQYLSRCSTSD